MALFVRCEFTGGGKMKRVPIRVFALLIACIGGTNALAESKYNMPVGVTPLSRQIYDLHMTIFWVCVAIGVLVFGVMIYSLIMHRKSRGVVAAKFHEHPWVEVIWAVIPFLILIGMAVPATKVLMAMDDTAAAELTIKITGYQWKWRYEYLDQGISFFSNLKTSPAEIRNEVAKNPHYLLDVDNPLIVPTNQKIRFLVTASDVIHSWWVPQLGIKRDGVPGFINESWANIEKPGIYRGQCAELCGLNHGYMPIVVQAVSPEAFDKWVASNKKPVPSGVVTVPSESEAVPPPAQTPQSVNAKAVMAVAKKLDFQTSMEKGKEVYERACAVCHKSDGTGMPPVFLPLKGSSVSTGKPISRHIDIILNGREGSAMQAFREQLNDEEIATVTTYERNAWGNNTGDVIQPSEVASLRAEGEKTQ